MLEPSFILPCFSVSSKTFFTQDLASGTCESRGKEEEEDCQHRQLVEDDEDNVEINDEEENIDDLLFSALYCLVSSFSSLSISFTVPCG